MTDIEFRPVCGYEGMYEVSNTGLVRSQERKVPVKNFLRIYKSRILKPSKSRKGYLRVALYKDGVQNVVEVHRLVALAFIENGDATKNQVNHKDGMKENNNVYNLEWVTPKENTRHAWETGLAGGSKAPN